MKASNAKDGAGQPSLGMGPKPDVPDIPKAVAPAIAAAAKADDAAAAMDAAGQDLAQAKGAAAAAKQDAARAVKRAKEAADEAAAAGGSPGAAAVPAAKAAALAAQAEEKSLAAAAAADAVADAASRMESAAEDAAKAKQAAQAAAEDAKRLDRNTKNGPGRAPGEGGLFNARRKQNALASPLTGAGLAVAGAALAGLPTGSNLALQGASVGHPGQTFGPGKMSGSEAEPNLPAGLSTAALSRRGEGTMPVPAVEDASKLLPGSHKMGVGSGANANLVGTGSGIGMSKGRFGGDEAGRAGGAGEAHGAGGAHGNAGTTAVTAAGTGVGGAADSSAISTAQNAVETRTAQAAAIKATARAGGSNSRQQASPENLPPTSGTNFDVKVVKAHVRASASSLAMAQILLHRFNDSLYPHTIHCSPGWLPLTNLLSDIRRTTFVVTQHLLRAQELQTSHQLGRFRESSTYLVPAQVAPSQVGKNLTGPLKSWKSALQRRADLVHIAERCQKQSRSLEQMSNESLHMHRAVQTTDCSIPVGFESALHEVYSQLELSTRVHTRVCELLQYRAMKDVLSAWQHSKTGSLKTHYALRNMSTSQEAQLTSAYEEALRAADLAVKVDQQARSDLPEQNAEKEKPPLHFHQPRTQDAKPLGSGGTQPKGHTQVGRSSSPRRNVAPKTSAVVAGVTRGASAVEDCETGDPSLCSPSVHELKKELERLETPTMDSFIQLSIQTMKKPKKGLGSLVKIITQDLVHTLTGLFTRLITEEFTEQMTPLITTSLSDAVKDETIDWLGSRLTKTLSKTLPQTLYFTVRY